MKTNIWKYGLIDGCANALLLFLALDIISSVFMVRYDIGVIVICMCALLSTSLFLVCSLKLEGSIAKCFWIGQFFFVIARTILFLFEVEGLHILPRREMANAEGFIIILYYLVYLFLSLMIRFSVCLLVPLYRKNSKSH